MATYVGTWVYDGTASNGDFVHLMRVEVLDGNPLVGWGTFMGLGWAPTLRVWGAGASTRLCTYGGSFEANADDPESAVLFQIGNESTATFNTPTATTLVPAANNAVYEYESNIIMVDPSGNTQAVLGSDGDAEVFIFKVKRIP